MGVLRSAVIVNPTKCDEAGLRTALEAQLAEAGWPAPTWAATTTEHTGRTQAQEAVAAGAQVLFVGGGDGTVMECAGALAGTPVALCVLPLGTGNLLARNLRLPTDIAGAISAAVDGERRRIDVGRVGERCFTVMAGIGFDARMMDDAPEALKARTGAFAYAVSALRHLRGEYMHVDITLDGGTPLRRRARSVLVANMGDLQAGVRLLRKAEPDDGVLDVAVIAPRTLRHWLTMSVSILLHRRRVPHMDVFTARTVGIQATRPQARELDGDVIDSNRELAVAIDAGALVVCVPREQAGTSAGQGETGSA
ncbi:diacylglycerol/lipid kinase family protein [Hamadaea tsunoensis]|uniref:diacylglycerol/lipid kinase family protein n=1 Tax=Hamadaea tsunoensis TaxID=53368 RepID=UPI00042152A7|nr:diacylglycerol kinase family protein [Hamadaea tsunoensis]